jgi:threonine/homoserine/homoserine lactone efflux protein
MAAEQEIQPTVPAAEEAYDQAAPQEMEYESSEDTADQEHDKHGKHDPTPDRTGFIHGLSVGLGIGCIAAFAITWISLFFTPQMPVTITYEALLSVFIYPLIYLLAVGLIALTAGVVREYYAAKQK